jgi:DNA-binding phage protein
LASCLEDAQLDPAIMGYFHGLSQDEAHELVMEIFLKMAQTDNITRAFLARRLGKSPEQITRWLSAPGNWTLDTFTNLLLAMGYRPTFGAERLSDMRQSNDHHPEAGRISRGVIDITLNNAHTTYNILIDI